MRTHYIVGNKYEGCGHRHKTLKTARKCHCRTREIIGFRTSVYRIFFVAGKRNWKRIP